MKIMIESRTLARIPTYMDENKILAALEAKSQQILVVEAIKSENSQANQFGSTSQLTTSKSRRLDYIYDNEPLGFEKHPIISTNKMQVKDPLKEIELVDVTMKGPTYISVKLALHLKEEVIKVLKEFRDCFAWDYDEMDGLSHDLVKLKLSIKPDKKQAK